VLASVRWQVAFFSMESRPSVRLLSQVNPKFIERFANDDDDDDDDGDVDDDNNTVLSC